MTIVVCPRCGGQCITCVPPSLPGDIRIYDSTGASNTYMCPVCNGRGWIDTDLSDEITALKSAVLLAAETTEHLATECVARGDRIKELEEFKRIGVKYNADELIFQYDELDMCCKEMRSTIKELESQRDRFEVVNTKLMHESESNAETIAGLVSDKTVLQDTIQKMIAAEDDMQSIMYNKVARLEAKNRDITITDDSFRLLVNILKIVKPMIDEGKCAFPIDQQEFATQMYKLCLLVDRYGHVQHIDNETNGIVG